MKSLIKPDVYDSLYKSEQYTKYECIMPYVKDVVNGTIIDIGCGTGLLIEYLDHNFAGGYERYICVEPDEDMISIAKSRNTGYRILYVQSYAEDDPLREHIGDVVLSISTWGVFSDKPLVLKLLKAMLRENRVVVLTGHPRTYNTPPSTLDKDYVYTGSCIDDIYIAKT